MRSAPPVTELGGKIKRPWAEPNQFISMANTSTSLRGITRVSHAPQGAVRNQSVTASVATGAGQAVSLASLKSISPAASARVEDITGREDELMQEAAAFMAAYSAAAAPTVERAAVSQPAPIALLGMGRAASQPSLVAQSPDYSQLQQRVVESEQRLFAAIDEIKEAVEVKVGAADFKAWGDALMQQMVAVMTDGLAEVHADVNKRMDSLTSEVHASIAAAKATATAPPAPEGGGGAPNGDPTVVAAAGVKRKAPEEAPVLREEPPAHTSCLGE